MKSLDIIFEDPDILVINKPPGLVVNRSESQVNTLADLVSSYLSLELRAEGGEMSDVRCQPPEASLVFDGMSDVFIERSGIVHRLDKETSGIILVAKNLQAFEKLQSQFKKREVRKEYLALCHGHIKEEKGEIDKPIIRLRSGRFGVVESRLSLAKASEGKEAVTEFEKISDIRYQMPAFQKLISEFGKKLAEFYEKEGRDYTYLRLFPKTGRTHQIRVHLKSIGHPLVSDPLYLGRRFEKFDQNFCPRLFLHASKIGFFHPKTGKNVNFESEIPIDLQKVLDKLE